MNTVESFFESHADLDKGCYIKKSALRNYVIILLSVSLISMFAGWQCCSWQYRDAKTITDISQGLQEAFTAQRAYSDSLNDLRGDMTVLKGTVKAQGETMMRHINLKVYKGKGGISSDPYLQKISDIPDSVYIRIPR